MSAHVYGAFVDWGAGAGIFEESALWRGSVGSGRSPWAPLSSSTSKPGSVTSSPEMEGLLYSFCKDHVLGPCHFFASQVSGCPSLGAQTSSPTFPTGPDPKKPVLDPVLLGTDGLS